ncbi:ABC transporter permease [Kocuria sp.]|uniref:ABC transporter permease n=1 Tax=Kocuria sp. TaxID=1871328 RepID=UPI0026DC1CDA|nr:ABC transporter permease [Kocuria sp.]MDO4919390.1 ABC transporter permease [Kocuria sp.]
MSHVQTPVRRPRPEWTKSVRAALIASVVVSIILLAFAWPTVTSKVQDLPVAVVGSQEQIDSLTDKMPDDNPLALHPVANRQDAENGIRSREVYGAILLGDQPEILTASAGSPVASQMLTSIGTTMQRGIDQQVISKQTEALQQMKSAMAQGPSGMAAMAQQAQKSGQGGQQAATPPTVKITDVVPLSGDDPRGAGLAIAGLPLTMGGMIGGVLISLLVNGPRKHLLAIVLYGIIGGLALACLMQGLFHILQGNFFANAGAIGLGIAATASVIVGLNALIGRPGIGVGAVITMFIGNPLSSLTQPKEFIAPPFGEIGQWLVPGLSGTVLRDLSYFPDANVSGQIWALIGWLAAGVVLVLSGHYRNQAALPGNGRGGDADGAQTTGGSSTAGAHHTVTTGEGTHRAASQATTGTASA